MVGISSGSGNLTRRRKPTKTDEEFLRPAPVSSEVWKRLLIFTRMKVSSKSPRNCITGIVRPSRVEIGQILVDRGDGAKEAMEKYAPLKTATDKTMRICLDGLIRDREARAPSADDVSWAAFLGCWIQYSCAASSNGRKP